MSRKKIAPPATVIQNVLCQRCGTRVTQVHGGMIRPRSCPIPDECTFRLGIIYAQPILNLDAVDEVPNVQM